MARSHPSECAEMSGEVVALEYVATRLAHKVMGYLEEMNAPAPVVPEPDGHITIVYFGEHPDEVFFFKDIKDWFWSKAGHHEGVAAQFNVSKLVIQDKDGNARTEIAADVIRKVVVTYNGEEFVSAKEAFGRWLAT
jgi:hypothetical protein